MLSPRGRGRDISQYPEDPEGRLPKAGPSIKPTVKHSLRDVTQPSVGVCSRLPIRQGLSLRRLESSVFCLLPYNVPATALLGVCSIHDRHTDTELDTSKAV